MSITRMLILSGFLGLAACTGTTGPSDPPIQVGPGGPGGLGGPSGLGDDRPHGHCLPNGGGCVNPHQ